MTNEHDPIFDAIIALGMEQAIRNDEMTPGEKADFIRAKLSAAVPVKREGDLPYRSDLAARDELREVRGYNECLKALGLGGE